MSLSNRRATRQPFSVTSAPPKAAMPRQIRDNGPKRAALYKLVAAFMRAYANLANEMGEVGYSDADAQEIRAEVDGYDKVRQEVMLGSGDYIDLKQYEPAMRHLLDSYIRAEESKKQSAFDDMTLVEADRRARRGSHRRVARRHPRQRRSGGGDDRE